MDNRILASICKRKFTNGQIRNLIMPIVAAKATQIASNGTMNRMHDKASDLTCITGQQCKNWIGNRMGNSVIESWYCYTDSEFAYSQYLKISRSRCQGHAVSIISWSVVWRGSQFSKPLAFLASATNLGGSPGRRSLIS